MYASGGRKWVSGEWGKGLEVNGLGEGTDSLQSTADSSAGEEEPELIEKRCAA